MSDVGFTVSGPGATGTAVGTAVAAGGGGRSGAGVGAGVGSGVGGGIAAIRAGSAHVVPAPHAMNGVGAGAGVTGGVVSNTTGVAPVSAIAHGTASARAWRPERNVTSYAPPAGQSRRSNVRAAVRKPANPATAP